MKMAFSCPTKWGNIEIKEFDYNFFELTLLDRKNWKLSGFKFSETQNQYIKEEIGVENNVKRLDLIEEFIDLLTGGI